MTNSATVPATHIPGVRYFHGRYFVPVTPFGTRPRNVAVTGTAPRTRSYIVAVPTGRPGGYPEWSLSHCPFRGARPAYVPRHARAA